jgi:hypothetical protein
MRTTLQIDDDVLDSAKVIAAAEHRTIGAVISELARRSLRPAGIRIEDGLAVFDVGPDAPAITSTDVARAMDDD